MSKWLSFIGFGSCAVVFYLLISGCTLSEAYTEPDQLFHKALDQLLMEHYVVQWEDPGSIISQQSLNMNWNPLENTERYRNNVSEITIDRDQSNQQGIVLSVILDNHIAKEILLDQLHSQMNVIRTEFPLVNKFADHQLSMADEAKMNNEIKEFMNLADRQLLKRLDTSQVHSTMLLWVDRITDKPIRVQFNTIIDYLNNGQSMKESLTDSFLISNK